MKRLGTAPAERRPHLGPGMRLTRQRRVIWELLAGRGGHLTADEILAQVRQAQPSIARSTVYRALEALEATGDVRAARLGGPSVRYEVADRAHHHAICQACGRVQHLDEELVGAIEAELARRARFTAVQTDLVVLGLCAACARRPVPAEFRRP
ncbi:MAG: transcriptional repressor [Candidatus Dormibacteraeota bacterium]|nr:transcriptional repressor [Candidatus Dormibacteraeota bacterium]